MIQRLVCLESPFWSPDPAILERNICYLAWCIRDCYMRNEGVYAGHGLGPLAVHEAEHRNLGLSADAMARSIIKQVVYYIDFGFSPGMLEAAKQCAYYASDGYPPPELRCLAPSCLENVIKRTWPPSTLKLMLHEK